jgi:hypothetical protein
MAAQRRRRMTIANEIEAVEWAKNHVQDFGKRAHMRQAEIDQMRERLDEAIETLKTLEFGRETLK